MMNNKPQKILACVDQSRFADCVADYAAWAAAGMGLPIEFLHILTKSYRPIIFKDHSAALGFDAHATLLHDLTNRDHQANVHRREQGRRLLNALCLRVKALGVAEPDARQRYGELGETLVEQQNDVALFILGRRGEAAQTTQRDLGRSVERAVRLLQKPILTVTDHFTLPERLLIAFDDTAITRQAVSLVAENPLFQNIECYVLMSGKPHPNMDQPMAWATETLQNAGLTAHALFIPGDIERAVAKAINEQKIDLLVMGAYSHSSWRSWLFGSITSDLLRALKIPTLLVR